jgi:hypothetical protein
MLPKLAEVFGSSVDALLGVAPREPEAVHEAEVVTDPEPELNTRNHWEFHYDAGRKTHIWFAVWVLLLGVLMLFRLFSPINVTPWGFIWPSALLFFGLYGIYPSFSFFRLGCAVFGGYVLLESLEITHLGLDRSFALPLFVLLLGLHLLVEAFKKPEKRSVSFTHNGKPAHIPSNHCTQEDGGFSCAVTFGDEDYHIRLTELAGGTAAVTFGELTVDLTGCEALAPEAWVTANCSFGELTLCVPRRFRAEVNASTSFGNVEIDGVPCSEPEGILYVDARANFGEITIDYI